MRHGRYRNRTDNPVIKRLLLLQARQSCLNCTARVATTFRKVETGKCWPNADQIRIYWSSAFSKCLSLSYAPGMVRTCNLQFRRLLVRCLEKISRFMRLLVRFSLRRNQSSDWIAAIPATSVMGKCGLADRVVCEPHRFTPLPRLRTSRAPCGPWRGQSGLSDAQAGWMESSFCAVGGGRYKRRSRGRAPIVPQLGACHREWISSACRID